MKNIFKSCYQSDKNHKSLCSNSLNLIFLSLIYLKTAHNVVKNGKSVVIYSQTIAIYAKAIVIYAKQIAIYAKTIVIYVKQIAIYAKAIVIYTKQIAIYAKTIVIYALKYYIFVLKKHKHAPENLKNDFCTRKYSKVFLKTI